MAFPKKIVKKTVKKEEEVKITAVESVEPTVTPLEEETDVKIIGTVGDTPVKAQIRGIRHEAYTSPVPMFKIPAEIRSYLLSNGFGTDVWKKDKAWLEAHNADMKMIEKLKKFLSDNYNGVN